MSHIIIGASGKVKCSVNHYEFEADGVCIDSDVLHTACVTDGELLICLFDKTSLFADGLDRRYLKGQNYAVLDEETVTKIRNAWLDTHSPAAVDEVITGVLGISDLSSSMDERIQNALETLKSYDSLTGLHKETGIGCLSFCQPFFPSV